MHTALGKKATFQLPVMETIYHLGAAEMSLLPVITRWTITTGTLVNRLFVFILFVFNLFTSVPVLFVFTKKTRKPKRSCLRHSSLNKEGTSRLLFTSEHLLIYRNGIGLAAKKQG